jgi:hypothetical protein
MVCGKWKGRWSSIRWNFGRIHRFPYFSYTYSKDSRSIKQDSYHRVMERWSAGNIPWRRNSRIQVDGKESSYSRIVDRFRRSTVWSPRSNTVHSIRSSNRNLISIQRTCNKLQRWWSWISQLRLLFMHSSVTSNSSYQSRNYCFNYDSNVGRSFG